MAKVKVRVKYMKVSQRNAKASMAVPPKPRKNVMLQEIWSPAKKSQHQTFY